MLMPLRTSLCLWMAVHLPAPPVLPTPPLPGTPLTRRTSTQATGSDRVSGDIPPEEQIPVRWQLGRRPLVTTARESPALRLLLWRPTWRPRPGSECAAAETGRSAARCCPVAPDFVALPARGERPGPLGEELRLSGKLLAWLAGDDFNRWSARGGRLLLWIRRRTERCVCPLKTAFRRWQARFLNLPVF